MSPLPYKICLSAKSRRAYSITYFDFSFFFFFFYYSTSITSSGPSSTMRDRGCSHSRLWCQRGRAWIRKSGGWTRSYTKWLKVINLFNFPQLGVRIQACSIKSFTPYFNAKSPSDFLELGSQALSCLGHANIIGGLLSLCFLDVFPFKLLLLLLGFLNC